MLVYIVVCIYNFNIYNVLCVRYIGYKKKYDIFLLLVNKKLFNSVE